MKIAFVDNLHVGGGLSRFSYMLSKKLVEHNKDLYIDYFINAGNLERTPEMLDLPERIKIIILETTKNPKPPRFIKVIADKFLKKLNLYNEQKKLDTIKEIEERVVDYDLAYFPVAHMMRKPNLTIPIVGTIHDFNWKYFFGRQIFPLSFVQEMDFEIVKWLTTCKTACSSFDVANEAKKLYPSINQNPAVIHLAPLVFSENIDDMVAIQILKKLKINFRYIIFPGNFFPHKNHLNLISAFSKLKKISKHADIKLILTGVNTDQIPTGVAEKFGARMIADDKSFSQSDIIGLGYQTNQVVEVLIKNALLLVSPSIYEAICTPGMDAWYYGTPTAISNISPFKEHENILGIKSAYFDPMDVDDIVEVIDKYISNYDQAKIDGQISKENIVKYTWDMTATKYQELFNSAINL